MTDTELLQIANSFAIDSAAVEEIKPLGPGFINDTFVVRTAGSTPDYILQRKNNNIFPNVPAMMDNIVAVTAHLRKKVEAAGGDSSRKVLTVVPAADGKNYVEYDGQFWAMCEYIAGSVTYERADTPELARKGGEGIGEFQSQLADFTTSLYPTIEGFHDMRFRFKQWDEAIKRDAAGRVKDLAEEISWIESRRDKMLAFKELMESGVLPQRVTHNDTKISNILFDKNGEVLCVIDLDTVMSSCSLNDYGDAIRSYANKGAEDDPDTSKVGLDLEIFKAYTEGYLSRRRETLTQAELDNLAFSALYITYEQVLRFLMDYIDGDTYYKIAYPEHNLVRTRAQYALLQSMESNFQAMQEVVNACK